MWYELIFAVDGTSRRDVIQGILGDCWLLSTCAAVAKREELMHRVLDPAQVLFGPEYKGYVEIKLWRWDWAHSVGKRDTRPGFFWTLLRQWKQVYLPENWVLVKISGVFKNSGPNFWYFPWVLHFLCSKLILFLPEKWVLQPKFWVLRKKLAEFWNLSSFGQAEFLK